MNTKVIGKISQEISIVSNLLLYSVFIQLLPEDLSISSLANQKFCPVRENGLL
jgi:hypothetical protein